MKTITVGITGAIGATNIENYLLTLSVKYTVNVILTKNAEKFVSINVLKYYANNVYSDFFDSDKEVLHAYLGRISDLVIIIPATANIIGKIAHGIADDLLTSTILNYTGKLIIAPNMNENMWNNPIVQNNVSILKSYDHKIINTRKISYIVCEKKFMEIGAALPSPKEVLNYINNEIGF